MAARPQVTLLREEDCSTHVLVVSGVSPTIQCMLTIDDLRSLDGITVKGTEVTRDRR